MAAGSMHVPPDGGYGWVVVFGSWVIHFVVLGLQYSFGVLFSGLLDDPDLNANRSTGSWVGSVAAGMMLVVSIPVGHLIQPYGCRKLACLGSILTAAGLFISSVVPSLFWLYVSYGVLVGAGFSFSFAPAVNAVAQYFARRRSLAIGVAVSGSGCGTFGMAAITNALLHAFGWRIALRALSVAALVLIGLSAMLFAPVKLVPRAQQKSGTAAAKAVQVVPLSSSGDANSNASDNASGNATTGAVIASSSTPAPKPMLQGNANGDSVTMAVLPQATAVSAPAVSARRPFRKMRNFQLMIVSLVMLGFGYMVPFVHLVTFAEDQGLSRKAGSNLVALIGIASTVGRVVFGHIADMPQVNRVYLYVASMGMVGAGCFLLPLSETLPPFVAFSVIFGMFAGSFVALMPVIVSDVVGEQDRAAALGYAYGCQVASVMTGAPAGGWLFNVTGTYTYTWLMAGSAICGGSAVLLCMRHEENRGEHRIHATSKRVTPSP